jgi:hypothetical protein
MILPMQDTPTHIARADIPKHLMHSIASTGLSPECNNCLMTTLIQQNLCPAAAIGLLLLCQASSTASLTCLSRSLQKVPARSSEPAATPPQLSVP